MVLFAMAVCPSGVIASERTVPIPESLERIFAGAPPRTADDLKSMDEHIHRVAAHVLPCTVGIMVGVAHGSGVIVSPDGYVLTAAHVGGTPGRVATFVLADGRVVRGETLGADVHNDAGLMKITQAGTWPFAQVADSSRVRPGQWCLATGHPGGYEGGRSPVLRIGRVTARWHSSIRTDCTLASGDSGGPLFDMNGRVIGIHSRVGVPVATNLHVPVGAYLRNWDRLVAGELWGLASPFIGVVRDSRAQGAAILRVHTGSPAEQAGLKSGDVIRQFDGRSVQTFDQLVDLVRGKQPGQTVAVEIQREGVPMQLRIRIGGKVEE